MKRKKRSAADYARIYGSVDRVQWIAAQPSVASGRGPCVGHHVQGGGGSRKADACWIVPITASEHAELHQHGKRWFEAKYGVNLDTLVAQTDKFWFQG